MTESEAGQLPFGDKRTAPGISLAGHDTHTEEGKLADLRLRVAALTEENRTLTEKVEARDALLAVAGHELRNPMTPILGRVEMLQRLVSKPEFQREKVQASLEQIEWLIGQYMKRATTLLDVSRITSGRLELSCAPIEVGSLVRQVVDNFRPLAERAGSTLTAGGSDNIIALGDPLALEEIIDNLVSNAIKYGGGKPISVSAVADEQAGRVELLVQDQGAGISTEDQARIFERFERVVTQTERRGSYGVGLWIVRQLTEAMGGKIAVQSESGSGSTFKVSIPLQTSKDIS